MFSFIQDARRPGIIDSRCNEECSGIRLVRGSANPSLRSIDEEVRETRDCARYPPIITEKRSQFGGGIRFRVRRFDLSRDRRRRRIRAGENHPVELRVELRYGNHVQRRFPEIGSNRM
jgi:hypothetical protein